MTVVEKEKIKFYIRGKTAGIPLARRVKVFYWTPPTTGAPRTIAPYDPIDFAGGINLGAKSGIGPGRPAQNCAHAGKYCPGLWG